MSAYGAIDLMSGSSSLTGADLWDLDKSPLNQLNGGIDDVIGKQANETGSIITSLSQWLTNSILGFEQDAQSTFADIDTYFSNIEAFLGGLNFSSPNFNLETAAEDFINLILNPTGLLSNTEAIDSFVEAVFNGLDGIGTATNEAVQELLSDLKTTATEVSDNFENMVDEFIGFLGGTTTGDITTDLNNLYSQWDNIPLIGPLVEALTGTTPAGTPSSSDWLNWLEGFGTLGQNSGLNSNNLFNQVSSDLLGMIHISHIGQAPSSPNLVSDPNFTTGNSVAGGLFSQDPTQTFGGVAGSAKVIADGTGPKTLLSNLIGVSPGQTLAVSAQAQWTSFTATGQPFVLGLNYYSDIYGANLLSQPQIASLAASPATTTWQQLAGNSTVPSGAFSVRLRLDLLPAATSGTGWFTAATLAKTGLLPAILSSFSGGGTVDQTLVTHATQITQMIADFENTINTSTFGQLITALGGGSELTDVEEWVNTLLTGSSNLNGALLLPGSVPTTAVPDLGNLFNNIVNNVLGQIGDDFGLSDVINAFTHQSDVITGQAGTIITLNQQVAALQASLAGAQLVTASDSFLRVNNTNLGSNWAQQFSTASEGTYATPSGKYASWGSVAIAPPNNITVINQWVGANQHSATDDQEVTIVLFSQGQNPFLGTSSAIDVLARMSDDRKNFIRMRFGSDGSLYISRVINSAESPIQSYPAGHMSPVPGVGASLTLLTGLPGLPRAFQGFMNGNLVISCNDTVSLYGTSYRGWGFGAVAGVNPLYIGQSLPPNVSQWTATG